MTTIDVEFDDGGAAARIDRHIAELESPSGELAKAWRQVGSEYLADQRVRFDRNSRGGGEWPKLAASTVARKGNNVILVDKGDLERSLAEGQAGNVFRPVPNGIDVGTADPKAKYHQTGTSRMPKRAPIAPPSDDSRQTIRGILSRAIAWILSRN